MLTRTSTTWTSYLAPWREKDGHLHLSIKKLMSTSPPFPAVTNSYTKENSKSLMLATWRKTKLKRKLRGWNDFAPQYLNLTGSRNWWSSATVTILTTWSIGSSKNSRKIRIYWPVTRKNFFTSWLMSTRTPAVLKTGLSSYSSITGRIRTCSW